MKLRLTLKLLLPVLALAFVATHAQTPSSTSVKALKHAQVKTAKPLNMPIGCATDCLWYAGDWDPTNENENGLYNASTPNYDAIVAQTWVAFVPGSDGLIEHNGVSITSITFNEITYEEGAPDVTAMTYQINSGSTVGSGGTAIASGNCTYAQPTATGRSGDGYTEYAFTCTLPTSAILKVGTTYWVNILPTISDEASLYVTNAIDTVELDHVGWGNIYNQNYFNSPYFDCDWVNANTQGDGYFSAFSVGMTGTYTTIKF